MVQLEQTHVLQAQAHDLEESRRQAKQLQLDLVASRKAAVAAGQGAAQEVQVWISDGCECHLLTYCCKTTGYN